MSREIIQQRSTVDPNTGCWMWGKGPKSRYGMVTVNGKKWVASRLSYESYVGPIPDGMFVCHKCDTPACVNPEHLFAGTSRDNVMDMYQKGRRAKPQESDPSRLNMYVRPNTALERVVNEAIAKGMKVSDALHEMAIKAEAYKQMVERK